MKENNTKVSNVIKSIVNKIVDGEVNGWPPGCATLLYQPERPVKPSEKKE